jgi:hypothetical protein
MSSAEYSSAGAGQIPLASVVAALPLVLSNPLMVPVLT